MKTLIILTAASLLFVQSAVLAQGTEGTPRATRPCTVSVVENGAPVNRPCAPYLPAPAVAPQIADPGVAAAMSNGAMTGVAIGIAVVAVGAIASTIGGGGRNSATAGSTGTTGNTGTTGTIAAH